MTYPDVPTGFGHWLAGFIDGEGSFNIEHRRGRAARGYACTLSIALREDDAAILLEIQQATGIGHIYPAKGNNSIRWIVHRKAECARLVELLDQFPLRAKKRRDYGTWREAVKHWQTCRSGAKGINWSPIANAQQRLRCERLLTPTAWWEQ